MAIEMLYKKFMIGHDNLSRYFTKLDVRDYIALHILDIANQKDESGNKKIYLKNVAERMDQSIRIASNMARELQDKGLVEWSHDGDGSEGTYITMTETGRQLLHEQEEITWYHFDNIIKEFGPDKLTQLLDQIRQLDEIIEKDMSGMQEEA